MPLPFPAVPAGTPFFYKDTTLALFFQFISGEKLLFFFVKEKTQILAKKGQHSKTGCRSSLKTIIQHGIPSR